MKNYLQAHQKASQQYLLKHNYNFQRDKQELIQQLLQFAIRKQQRGCQDIKINHYQSNVQIIKVKNHLKESLINELNKQSLQNESISLISNILSNQTTQQLKLQYLNDYLRQLQLNQHNSQKCNSSSNYQKIKQRVKYNGKGKQISKQQYNLYKSSNNNNEDEDYHIIRSFFKDKRQEKNQIIQNNQMQHYQYNQIKTGSKYINQSTMALSKFNKNQITPQRYQRKTQKLTPTPKHLELESKVYKSYLINSYSAKNRDSSQEDKLDNWDHQKKLKLNSKQKIIVINNYQKQQNSEEKGTGRFKSQQKSNQKQYSNPKNHLNFQIKSRASKNSSHQQLEYSQSNYVHSEYSLLPSIVKGTNNRMERSPAQFQPQESYENLFNSEVTKMIYKANSYQMAHNSNASNIKKVTVDLNAYKKDKMKGKEGNENIKNIMNNSKQRNDFNDKNIQKSIDRKSKCSEASQESAMTFNINGNKKEAYMMQRQYNQEDQYIILQNSIKRLQQKALQFENIKDVLKINEQKFKKAHQIHKNDILNQQNATFMKKSDSIFKKKLDYKNQQGLFTGSSQLNLRRYHLNKQGNKTSDKHKQTDKNINSKAKQLQLSNVEEELSIDYNQFKDQKVDDNSGIISYLKNHLLKFTNNKKGQKIIQCQNKKQQEKSVINNLNMTNSNKQHSIKQQSRKQPISEMNKIQQPSEMNQQSYNLLSQPQTNKKQSSRKQQQQCHKDIKSLSSIKKSSSNQKSRQEQSIQNSFFNHPSVGDKQIQSSCSFLKGKQKVTQNGILQVNNLVKQSVKNIEMNLVNLQNRKTQLNQQNQYKPYNNQQGQQSDNNILPKSLLFDDNSNIFKKNFNQKQQQKQLNTEVLLKHNKFERIFGKNNNNQQQNEFKNRPNNTSLQILDKSNEEYMSHPSTVKKISQRSYDKSELLRNLQDIKDDTIINNLFNQEKDISSCQSHHQLNSSKQITYSQRSIAKAQKIQDKSIVQTQKKKNNNVSQKVIHINLQELKDVNESQEAISFSKLINNTSQDYSSQHPYLESFRIDKSTNKKQQASSHSKPQGKINKVSKIQIDLQPIELDSQEQFENPSLKKKNTSYLSSNQDSQGINIADMQDYNSDEQEQTCKKSSYEPIIKPITKLQSILEEQMQESQLNHIKYCSKLRQIRSSQLSNNSKFNQSDLKSLQDQFLQNYNSSNSILQSDKSSIKINKQPKKDKQKITLKAPIKPSNVNDPIIFKKCNSYQTEQYIISQKDTSSLQKQSKQRQLLYNELKQSINSFKQKVSKSIISSQSSQKINDSDEPSKRNNKRQVRKITIDLKSNRSNSHKQDEQPENTSQLIKFPSSSASLIHNHSITKKSSKSNHQNSLVISDDQFQQNQEQKKAYSQFSQALNNLKKKIKIDAKIGLAMPQ